MAGSSRAEQREPRARLAGRVTFRSQGIPAEAGEPRESGLSTCCLISSYNYARYLGEAVDSAVKQTAAVDEIIIVDDGSTDGSARMVEERWSGVPQVHLIQNPNQGQLSCFNVGFETTTADLVFFLDADDVWESDYVETVLRASRAESAVDFVCAGVRFFGAVSATSK